MPTKRKTHKSKTTRKSTTRSSKKTTRRAGPSKTAKAATSRRRMTSARSRTGRRESGQPGGGAGRREEAGGSGVYPASAPQSPENAPYHGMASWGQGERGAAGYQDSGALEPSTYEGKKDLYGTARPKDQVRPIGENESRDSDRNQPQNQSESQRVQKQQGSQPTQKEQGSQPSQKPRQPRRFKPSGSDQQGMQR